MSEIEETKQCPNCKLDILSSNFTVHTVYCQRNIFVCSKCQQPVNYNQKDEHESESHINVYCTDCHIQLEKWCLKEHLINNCPYRKVKCQICDIEIKATDIVEHENYCGSRTEKCAECGEYVMFKYKTLHIESNHTFIKLSDEPGPSPSWQYGRRTLHNFLPDITSKNFKPLPALKRKSIESRRSRYSAGTNQPKNFDDSDVGPENAAKKNENDDGMKENDIFTVKEVEKLVKKDADEWPTLSSLTWLQISDDKNKDWRKSNQTNPRPSKTDEEQSVMCALKVSQDLYSHIWEKDLGTGEDEMLKNSIQTSSENLKSHEKNIDKNIVGSKNKKKTFDEDLKKYYRDDSDDDFFLPSNEHNGHSDQDPVKLPCEFCGNLIVAHNLYAHQSRCTTFVTESFDRRNSRHKFSSFPEDIEKKVCCGICNKFFRLSMLENHQMHCQRNLFKSWKNKDKVNYTRGIKPVSEPGLQNGVEQSSPRLTRGGTRSEWLSELSKSSMEGGNDFQNNLNHLETGVVTKTTKLSRKNRRAPSPPKM